MSHPHHFAHAHYSSALAFIAKVDTPFREHIAHPFGRETRVYHAMATLTTGKSHADHVRVEVTVWADQLEEVGGWGHLQSFHAGSDIIIEAYVKHVSVWEGMPRLEVTATSVRHPSQVVGEFDPFKSIAGAAESFVGPRAVAKELKEDESDHFHRPPHHPPSSSHQAARHHILPVPALPGHAPQPTTSPTTQASTIPLPSSDVMSLDPPYVTHTSHPRHVDPAQVSQAAHQPSSSQTYPVAPAPTPAMSQSDAYGVPFMTPPSQQYVPVTAPTIHPFGTSAVGPQPVTLTIGSATLADGHEYVGSLCLFPKPKTGEAGGAATGATVGGGMALQY